MSGEGKLSGYRYDPRLDPEVATLLRPSPPESETVSVKEMVDWMMAEFPGATGVAGLRERLIAIAYEYDRASREPHLPASREALEAAVAGCNHNGAGRPEGCVACKPWRAALLVTDDKEPAR